MVRRPVPALEAEALERAPQRVGRALVGLDLLGDGLTPVVRPVLLHELGLQAQHAGTPDQDHLGRADQVCTTEIGHGVIDEIAEPSGPRGAMIEIVQRAEPLVIDERQEASVGARRR